MNYSHLRTIETCLWNELKRVDEGREDAARKFESICDDTRRLMDGRTYNELNPEEKTQHTALSKEAVRWNNERDKLCTDKEKITDALSALQEMEITR